MSESPSFKPSLRLIDATMIVAGSMIGSGIFIVSADIIRNVGSSGWLLAVWVITGFMTLTAALSYGELSAMFPKAGGQYIYLREAYNPLLSFLYGWSFFAVIQTATIAAVAVAFAKFTAYLFPFINEADEWLNLGILKVSSAQLLSIVVLCFLSFINSRGIEHAKLLQTGITLAKLLSLLAIIVFGIWAIRPEVWSANWIGAWDIKALTRTGDTAEYLTVAALGAIAAAMVGAIFSADAWNNVTFIAGEIRNPRRNVGLSLALGTMIVICLYVLTNIVYVGVLPLNEIASADKDRVAVAASQVIFGASGTVIIAIMIMVATFGCANGMTMAGARVYYSMAKDGVFFSKVGRLNRFSVPSTAIWIQLIVSCIWVLSGKYGDLLDMISFVVVIFYMLTIYGIFILRRKCPDAERPYKAVGYPVLPILYIIMGISFCVLLIIFKPNYTWPGLLITLSGIPIFYLLKRSIKQPN